MNRTLRIVLAVITVLGVLNVSWNDPEPAKADITCRDSGVNCRWVVVTPSSDAGQVIICTVEVCANGFAGRTYQLEGDYAFDGPNPNTTTSSSTATTSTTTTSTTTTSTTTTSSSTTTTTDAGSNSSISPTTTLVGSDDSSTSSSSTSTSSSSSSAPSSSSSSSTTTTVFSVNCMNPGVVCGWAVVASSGVVHGVIVCTVDVCGSSGEWGGRLPVEYMGCPPGCRLALQAQQTSDGNVAGWHGSEVRYDDDSGSFSLPSGGSLRSGDRLEDAVFPTTTVGPSTTVESSPITAEETRTIIVNDTMYASVDEMAVGETTVVLGEQSLTIDLPTIGVAGSEYEVTFDPDGPSAPLTLAEGVVLESQSSKVERLAVTRPWRVVVSLRGVDKSKGKIAIELKVRGSKILVSQFRFAPTQKFTNCGAMRKVYPQGVAASRAARVVKRGMFVSSASARPIVSPVIYAKHRSLDTDRDRVVCER